MLLDKLIEKIKTGEQEELREAKKRIKRAFRNEKERKLIFNKLVKNLDEFSLIKSEKNKIAFIYGLKFAAKDQGREYFPLFSNFIIRNIQSESGNVRQAVIRLTDSLFSSLLIDSKDLSMEEKQALSEFIDEILMLLESYYDSDYEKHDDLRNLPPCVYKSLEGLLSKIVDPGKEKLFYDKNTKMPAWMDCTWKRNPCMKDGCPICEKLKEIEEFDDLFDRGEFLINVTMENKTIKKDLPKPDEFPFYNEIRKWMEVVILAAENSKITDDFWIFTEEAADIFWYMNVLSTKTYRQLCNRYLIENLKKDNSVDYQYTQYVLKESIKIIKKGIKEILKGDPAQSKSLNKSFENLSSLEEKILNI